MRSISLLAALVALAGCYQVRIVSEPVRATVAVSDGPAGTGTTRVKIPPLSSRKVTVEANGYRTLEFPVRWRPFGWLRRSHEVEVRLVEEHGAQAADQE